MNIESLRLVSCGAVRHGVRYLHPCGAVRHGVPDLRAALAAITIASAAAASGDVFNMGGDQKSLEFVTVGDPGNVAALSGDYPDIGAVNYVYQIGKYDVTVAQYTEFLNAVAREDLYGLYDTNMGQPGHWGTDDGRMGCGIARSGTASDYTYSVMPGRADYPVNYVSWGSAARFVNWLQNGQPTAAEGPGTTETGAYDLNGAVTAVALGAVPRSADARYALPSRNEWYKAAFYKGGGTSAGYWKYPTGHDQDPSNVLSATATNNASYYYQTISGYYQMGDLLIPVYEDHYSDAANLFTPVGAFAATTSPYGAYDMGGDIRQYNDDVVDGYFGSRVTSGSFFNDFLNAMGPMALGGADASPGNDTIGFRVVSVPEPGALALLAAGLPLLLLLLLRLPLAWQARGQLRRAQRH
jgi:formylglycine-generating enzyme